MSKLFEHDPFLCPFCGSNVLVEYDEDGPLGLLHAMPMCPTFNRLDVIEFMKACNLAVANRRRVGIG
jgi:hypothetical protein